jgi:hypothetical protein
MWAMCALADWVRFLYTSVFFSCFFGRGFFIFCLAFLLSPRSSCESAFERGGGVLGICVECPLVLVNDA